MSMGIQGRRSMTKGGREVAGWWRRDYTRFAVASRAPRVTVPGADTMIRVLLFLFCLVAGSHQFFIEKFYVPVSVEAGSNAELQCQVSKTKDEAGDIIVQWWWVPLQGTDEDKVLFYQHFIGRTEPQALLLDHKLNTTSKGNDTVVIYNMEPKYSGTYECEVTNVKEIHSRNTLTVYSKGTGPQLNISTVPDGPDDDSDDDVILQCFAYDVAPYPDLVVTINGENFSKLTETVSKSSQEGLYNVYANATLTQDDIDGAEIRCELFYKNKNVTHPAFVDVHTYHGVHDTLASAVPPEISTRVDLPNESLTNLPNGSRRQYTENSSLVGLVLVSLLYTLK